MNNNEVMERGTGLSRNQKFWLGLSVVGAVVSFWWLSMVGKVWQENVEKEMKIEELEMKLKEADLLEMEKKIYEIKLGELGEFFLKGETGVAGAAESMEEIAAETGVSLVLSFDDFPEQIDIGGVYQKGLGVYAEVEGSYQGMLEFVKRVEELPYFIRLSEVKVGLAKLESGIKAEFKGVIFLKNE